MPQCTWQVIFFSHIGYWVIEEHAEDRKTSLI